uniref:ABC transporter related n=1 Tax=Salinispora arenicola (strain CNS-205) TaxID=391037 RepID=A8M176_SALAI
MTEVVLDEVAQKFRGGFHLGPVSLNLTVGVTCLLGANGSGKTTLLRMLSGIDSPAKGTIQIGKEGKPGEAKSIGFLPQDFTAPKNATCQDFLHYVAWSRRVSAKSRETLIQSALSRTGLSDQAEERIGNISGGMLRRLGIAQALVHEPSFLILDEPTVGLDPGQRLRIRDQVRKLATDVAVLYSTHLVEDVRSLADQIIILRSGKVAFKGTLAEVEQSAEEGAPIDQPGAPTRLERGISMFMDEVE